MKNILCTTAIAALISFASLAPLTAQEATRPAGAQAFTPENAILNTAIPFAMGAREAQQSLRGAFGWATFQEGLVKGSYFRFDPDGYARFSPSPRLDTDVFEVICRPRTYTCLARKGGLSLMLNDLGQISLKMDDARSEDTFYLNDGFSDLQIPSRILGVLDPQLETLLSGGGRLVVRRNGDLLDQVSLVGLDAVVGYLRWIGARQDYRVLPRDWPIPNGANPASPATIGFDTHQPEVVPGATTFPETESAPVIAATVQEETDMDSDAAEIAVLKAELGLLRELVVAQNGSTQPTPSVNDGHNMPSFAGAGAPAAMPVRWTGTPRDVDDFFEALDADNQPNAIAARSQTTSDQDFDVSALSAEAQHLHYLTTRMGLEARTALLILQLTQLDKAQASAFLPTETQTSLLGQIEASMTPPSTRNSTDLGGSIPSNLTEASPFNADLDTEFQTLTAYFMSTLNP